MVDRSPDMDQVTVLSRPWPHYLAALVDFSPATAAAAVKTDSMAEGGSHNRLDSSSVYVFACLLPPPLLAAGKISADMSCLHEEPKLSLVTKVQTFSISRLLPAVSLTTGKYIQGGRAVIVWEHCLWREY